MQANWCTHALNSGVSPLSGEAPLDEDGIAWGRGLGSLTSTMSMAPVEQADFVVEQGTSVVHVLKQAATMMRFPLPPY